ncbi:MAG: 4a-hydroxytetrahydrobiopterin dehydratase [Candidatus Doudnabacteria bacterium RIFCSPLOWO2_02_FULL_49_13]|uniref:Putative pterin-4-alpha-carbinolamine dehydratase n=1 Tax=Candidatus Doudnabacteria bacterium RIFCSPHIGHO2_12_FULL_48_16 TaxID=1817838 RepID=A0A1F5PKY8_9BACT|nr:MAG: 4a-hydroxytetrahydrobiopterin dehydratase [Candidatus Doudnabacteria bacterium RIFCSPHIGHO2_02_FULL_49_24]OGE89090.1 MAG: 4a-hydroxytetrahydrobiopterin dehydratase [Candidatus Doudnabacteria bacterium RIFCSPHIGHO2_01_FULL_50_67]OGE90571.1 MAG: 4a-hydroxytetrahydrobiopterin dehydratase [Candidatus Doudnabacteria bacterium RIFCSPHIGHO2_12_FULL_48_16]OGE97608.1 MAG: 4a-hydroxytetrahydrobiopterin dehydratase [Candidatus Doudnabacteria bacterium RIFCSPLOWO2_01_FULL_49_40]OGF02963.1 MAG: 4a-h
MKLAQKRCIPCEGGIPPFGKKQIAKYLPQLPKGWSVIDDKKLRKRFQFKNFVDTMGFVNKIALIAQAEDHHPDMQISYSKVAVELWTHANDGLTENDFILAAKIDQLNV